MCYVTCPPLQIPEPRCVSSQCAIRTTERRKIGAGRDRSDTPARSAAGKSTEIYPRPTVWQFVAVRGSRIAGSVDGGKMQRLRCVHKIGSCISCNATVAAPLPSPASLQLRAGASAGNLRVRKMDKSSFVRRFSRRRIHNPVLNFNHSSVLIPG